MAIAPAPQRRTSPVIIGLAVGVGLGGALVLLRFEPAARALVAARQRRAALESSLSQAPAVVDLAPLQDEVDALRAEVEALTASNAERAARVAPPPEVPELEHQVATLARDAGLRLEQQEVVVDRTTAAPAESSRARRWTLSGGFAGLWRFIASLERLPRRVVLRDLQVTRAADAAGAPLARRRPQPPLRIQVTVVP